MIKNNLHVTCSDYVQDLWNGFLNQRNYEDIIVIHKCKKTLWMFNDRLFLNLRNKLND